MSEAQEGMNNPLAGKLRPVDDDGESEDVLDGPEDDQPPIDESDTPGDDDEEDDE